ncbi:hypothetical protein KBD59_01580 [Candidatus Gracilibacteria bacterium]|nr:hypothetical protein [Candidatus Gracilibacteria bacterium]
MISTIIQYGGTIVVFLVVIYFVTKFNKGALTQNIAQAKAENPLPAFAAAMGLQYQDLSDGSAGDKKVFMDIGSRVYGTYKGFPVEMIFSTKAREADKTPISAQYSYSYSIQKTVTFTVTNADGKHFEVLPKSEQIVSTPTGRSAFDAKLVVTGDNILPGTVLDYFGQLGWMNLTLKGNALTFHDSFLEQFTGVTAYSRIMSSVHPVWGTTIQKPAFDLEKGRAFFDKMVEVAQVVS